MTNKQSHKNGIISDDEINWLLERAKGNFGIITTAATNVSKDGKAWEGEFGVFDDMHIPKLIELNCKIHRTKSLIFAQLFHGGMRSPQNLTKVIPQSASRLKCKESKTGYCRRLNQKEIKNIIDDFSSAAIRCYKSGFDGIELHAAHGYLISQFLGNKSNLRKDKWGGNLKNRAKFLIEIINKIKKNVPESFLIGVRLSPEIESIGINILDTIKLIKIIKNLNIDFIHLSCWNVFNKPITINSNRTITEYILDKQYDLPTIISTGGVWNSIHAENVINQGADIVGVGRVAIAHPFWPKKILDIKYNPKHPPYDESELLKAKLGKNFINYMKKWDGFIKN